ncbi:MAG: thermopsin [Candidatus Thermoplasmatota archaeon]|nr:thermopsin [Candidatus Thermoplasmatota archaeon]
MNQTSIRSIKVALLVIILLGSVPLITHETVFSKSQLPNSDPSYHALTQTGQHTVRESINPYVYAGEPAPMGIASYGLGPENSAFILNSSSYIGIINISSIDVYNSSWPGKDMTFQLNLNLVFTYNGQDYVYWVQDVAYLSTSSREIEFLDNVWNSSSYTAQMYSSSITGNGTVATSGGIGYYYDEPQSIPGNLVVLSYPSEVILRINASTTSTGIPEVNFSYQDGYGWVTYDNVLFPFATIGYGSEHFMVNGYQPKPDGLPMDAELILGGPGGGSDTNDNQSALSLMLQYWNGNNYQSVFDAFNFGSNTAEGISNATVTPLDSYSLGVPGSEVTSGPGTLSMIYNTSEVGFVSILAPGYQSGSINVNDASIGYTGGRANITLAAGRYNLTLVSGGSTFHFHNVSVSPGNSTFLTTEKFYTIRINETGLPAGDSWAISINGTVYRSVEQNISVLEINGTYNLSVLSVPGYRPQQYYYEVSVDGSNVSVNLAFSVIRYQVTFVLVGSRNPQEWNVSIVGNGILGTSSTSLTVYLPNGTYYFIASTDEQRFMNYSGSFTVSASSLNVSVHLILKAQINIHSSIADSSVIINGNEFNFSSNFSAYLVPGNYSIFVTSEHSLPYFAMYDLKEDQTLNISANLTLLSVFGTITGTLNSRNAELFANGMAIPVVNGTFRQALSPGNYMISASAPGMEAETLSVQLADGYIQPLSLNLMPGKTFRVNGYVDPAGASLFFNGQPALESGSGSYLEYLTPGLYRVSVTCDGFVPYSNTINITENLTVNFTLTPLPALYRAGNASGLSVLASNGNVTQLKFTGTAVTLNFTSATGGYLLISVPYFGIRNSSIQQAISSRVFLNGVPAQNFIVALGSNYTVTLYLHISGDPYLVWLFNSSLPAPSPGSGNLHSGSVEMEYAVLGILILILVASVIAVRKR